MMSLQQLLGLIAYLHWFGWTGVVDGWQDLKKRNQLKGPLKFQNGLFTGSLVSISGLLVARACINKAASATKFLKCRLHLVFFPSPATS
jgi:hypothetical protein